MYFISDICVSIFAPSLPLSHTFSELSSAHRSLEAKGWEENRKDSLRASIQVMEERTQVKGNRTQVGGNGTWVGGNRVGGGRRKQPCFIDNPASTPSNNHSTANKASRGMACTGTGMHRHNRLNSTYSKDDDNGSTVELNSGRKRLSHSQTTVRHSFQQ